MVFSSYLFLFWFLPVALALYYGVPTRYRHLSLTLTSYVFYGWVKPEFCWLMLVSTLIDFAAGLVIAGRDADGSVPILSRGGSRTTRQRVALYLAVGANLGLLGYFKYANLAVDTWRLLFPLESGGAAEALWRVALPLGISFYTFQSMSYTIDVYRGEARAVRNFVDFACFVSMFPQLVAGPIIRYQEVADQLAFRTHTVDKFARGVAFLCLGLAKKVLLANPCGQVADLAFDNAPVGVLAAWGGLLGYSMQIYFDFSGYSDMAIGLGLMLGFMFPKNFDSPYRAASLTEFWHRWHMSLSTWLRDYLYIPLGGSRLGVTRTYLNLFVVMVLGGLWHGAAWNFVAWGAAHGFGLALERFLRDRQWHWNGPRAIRVATTFLLVMLGWVLFRCATFHQALDYYASLLGVAKIRPGTVLVGGMMWRPWTVLTLGLAALVAWRGIPTWEWTQSLTPAKALYAIGLFVLSIALLAMQEYNPFIYFIF